MTGTAARAGKKLSILALLFGAALSCANAPPASASEGGLGTEKFKIGDHAPDFTTVDLDGNTITLSAFRGKKVVFLNFWGVRCGACLEEMPHLDVLAKKYADRGLVALGVDTDGIDATLLRETMQETNNIVHYPILLDQDFAITDVYTNFLVPLSIIIDRQGVITFIHTGYEAGDEKEYEKEIKKVL